MKLRIQSWKRGINTVLDTDKAPKILDRESLNSGFKNTLNTFEADLYRLPRTPNMYVLHGTGALLSIFQGDERAILIPEEEAKEIIRRYGGSALYLELFPEDAGKIYIPTLD